MAKVSKKRKEALAKFDKSKVYSLTEAVDVVKQITYTKFDASVDLNVRLGVDPRKANQWYVVALHFLTEQVKSFAFWYYVHQTKKKKQRMPVQISSD